MDLARKLQIKDGQSVAVINLPDGTGLGLTGRQATPAAADVVIGSRPAARTSMIWSPSCRPAARTDSPGSPGRRAASSAPT